MKRLKLFKKIFVFILLPLLWGCSHSPSEVIDENGYFRGFRMGIEPDSLMSMETWKPAVKTDTLIVFKEKVEVKDHEYKLIVFTAFDAYGLFEVQVDCFPYGKRGHEEIYEAWRKKLNSAFGESELVFAARRWTTYSINNNLVEITLSNEKDDEGKDFVSLNYLEPLDDAY